MRLSQSNTEILKMRNDSNFSAELNVNATIKNKGSEIVPDIQLKSQSLSSAVPGMIVEDLAAKKLFNFITSEDPEGLTIHLKRH
jgi:hypothetical protein